MNFPEQVKLDNLVVFLQEMLVAGYEIEIGESDESHFFVQEPRGATKAFLHAEYVWRNNAFKCFLCREPCSRFIESVINDPQAYKDRFTQRIKVTK